MSALHLASALPPAWREAYERDRQEPPDLADPAPERRAARLLAAFIITGLFFLALPGTLVGVWNLLAIAQQRAPSAASTAWVQAHGQAQLLGWVVTFILGISIYVLPKVRGRPLERMGLAWVVWALWTAGITWRWWTGMATGSWRMGLAGSALLEFAAVALVHYLLWFPHGQSRAAMKNTPTDLGSWLGIAGFGALSVAMAVNAGIAVRVALHGSFPVYPPVANRIFLTLALWGFTVPLAWGYSTRFVTVFLGLEPPVHRAARWLAAGVAGLAIAALLGWFLAADLLALALSAGAAWALRIFHRPERAAKLLGVYRRYPAFVRLSYAWLLTSAVLGVAADLLPRYSGLTGSSRHAVTVGFLANLIFAIGPRILPSFLNSRELYSPALMGLSLWVLNAGCLLRVSSEAVAYTAGGTAWVVLPVSALLELTAVLLFAVNLALTLARRVPAWFGPQGISPRMALYWYVTAYPGTRRVLIEAGVSSLREARDVPRSLTLADAVAADGAELERVLEALRQFFSRRQPRRSKSFKFQV